MDLYDNNPVDRMWFGTEQKMGWIETPQTGADVSSIGQSANAVLQNGGGTVRNSWDSHKVYQFSWGVGASPSMASLLQAYRNGSYGRGLLYFHDPMFYQTNLLPKRWADPSMAVNFEADPLIPDANPTAVPVVSTRNNYPVSAAVYSVPAGYSSQANTSEHFIPIPEGMTLILGAVYSGQPRIYVRTPAGITDIIPMGSDAETVVNTVIRNQPWARIGLRNTGSASSITITGMTARLAASVPADQGVPFSYTNVVTNPSFEEPGANVEVRRNYARSPYGTAVLPGYAGYPNPLPAQESSVGGVTRTGVAPLPVPGHPATSLYVSIPGGAAAGGGVVLAEGLPAGDYFVSMWVNRRNGPTTQFQFAVRGVVGFGNARTFNFDEWTYLQEGFTVTPAAAPAVIGWRTVNVVDPAQTNFFVANMQVTPAGQQIPQGELVVSGANPNFDPDLTASFLGTPEASASVLRGVGVAGVGTSVGVAAVRSTMWTKEGAYSLRLIPKSPTSFAEYAVLTPPPNPGPRGTLVITRRQAAPVTGTTWNAGFGRVYWNPSPQRFSDPAPNEAGEMELRVYAPDIFSGSNIILPHGGLANTADIWYDVATIVPEINYAGPAFTGRTPGAVWNGTPDNSTSTLSGVNPINGPIGEGPWYSGEGHSGCRFQGNPTVINYNGVNGGQIGLSAILQEVGAWE